MTTMTQSSSSLLFLGKADDPDCIRALEYCQEHFSYVTYCLGKWGDPLPEDICKWKGDYIISYLSRWVVPQELLDRAGSAAINFHPASPEYPGIGCNNFALYEDAREYGVTCHHMAGKVDTGKIIKVRRFPVHPADGVEEILKRTYENQMALFFEIAQIIAGGMELPTSAETWTRPPFSRKQFDELFRITADMSQAEIARRVRATSYKNWQPYIELRGFRFEYKPQKTDN
jgi:methionyl-tRNA formyltransferase